MGDFSNHESLLGWVFAAIGTVMTVLSGIVAMFYKTQVEAHKAEVDSLQGQLTKLQLRADQCEDDREELRVGIGKLEVRVEFLEKENGRGVNDKRDSIGER